MNQTLDEALCRDFPLLFGDRHASMRETAMCWGFDCGDGWEPLIRRTAEKLEPLIRAQKDPRPFRASQIKEKFGTLRFYLMSGTDEMYTIVEQAEEESCHICETCGKPGKLRGHGWLYTACDAHTKVEDTANE